MDALATAASTGTTQSSKRVYLQRMIVRKSGKSCARDVNMNHRMLEERLAPTSIFQLQATRDQPILSNQRPQIPH